MVGGIQNVLSGNFSLEQVRNMSPMGPSTFDDSVGGASIGFGRGVSGQGTLLVSKLITNFTKSAPAKRSLLAREVGVGTNAITCQGVGGLASIASGLMTSGIVKLNGGSVPLDNRTLDALPKEPIVIISEGNKFKVKIQNTEITVNGIPVKRFAIITGLHIFFMTTAFFYVLPTYLALGAVQRLSVLINNPLDEASNKKWRKFLLLGVLFPTATAGLITGVIGMGSAQHFRTVHGILGLVTVIVVPLAIITGMLRLNTAVPLPSSAFLFGSITRTLGSPAKIHLIATFFIALLTYLSSVAWVLGFTELRSISLCILDAVLTAPLVVGFVSIVVFVQITAIGFVSIRMWLEQRVARFPSPLSKADLSPETGLMRNEAIPTAGSRRYTSARSDGPARPTRDTSVVNRKYYDS
ncbi:hypothetical protein BCR34DRAFT_609341 [Clohesyomyces aquaticus]|uniref:Cytochrome b561 domain-containing protein n=1 Tax=Clohesyomyces aquaticus TaxID=1231657 RepID=A0A1Y1XTK0_9PLEO|nr:hypothetical protein BCR34DRAFT_609341 [Clohesyomyces aquaticus]